MTDQNQAQAAGQEPTNQEKFVALVSEVAGQDQFFHETIAADAAKKLEEEGKLEEFFADYEETKKKNKQIAAQLVKSVYDKYNIIYRGDAFVRDIENLYSAEGANAEKAGDFAVELMEKSFAAHEEDGNFFGRLQAFMTVFKVNADDQEASVTGFIDEYANRREQEGFDVHEFADEVYKEFQNYQIANELAIFNQKIDAYYNGDKDAAKEMAPHMQQSDRSQILQALLFLEAHEKGLADAQAELEELKGQEGADEKALESRAAEIAEAKEQLEENKEEFLTSYNQEMDKFVKGFAHSKNMQPAINEYMAMVDEGYNAKKAEIEAEETENEEEKQDALAANEQLRMQGFVKAPAVLEKNVKEFIKDKKFDAAKAEAESNGAKFNEKEFYKTYEEPTDEEIEAAAATYIDEISEKDAAERHAKVTADVENYKVQDDPRVGQKIKPSKSATIFNGVLTFGSSAAAGMAVRGIGMGLGTMVLGSIGVAPILGAAIAGVAAGAVAGYASYNVTRLVKAFTNTRRERKENKRGTFGETFRRNFAATENNSAKYLSMGFGAIVGGTFAAYGSEIMSFVADKANDFGVTDAWNNTVGQVNFAGLTDWLPDLGLGGGAPDTVVDPNAFAGTVDDPVNPLTGASIDPLDAFGGAGPDVSDPAGDMLAAGNLTSVFDPDAAIATADGADAGLLDATDVAEASFTVPTAVDADLKEMIIEAARENGTTSYEASIIARLEGGTIGQQVQAAKDFSLLAGGEMQMTILERLNEDFGNLVFCAEVMQDPTLAEAVAQVNSDLGGLQLRQAILDGVTDGADNERLQESIINLMQGSEAGNPYAAQNLAVAERCYPEAFAAAQGEYTSLSENFSCATGTAEATAPAAAANEPVWGPDCDEDLLTDLQSEIPEVARAAADRLAAATNLGAVAEQFAAHTAAAPAAAPTGDEQLAAVRNAFRMAPRQG